MTQDELLQAIADERVVRMERDDQKGYWALYALDGTVEVERRRLSSLRSLGHILLPMLGPPIITEDGQSHLRNRA